MCARAWLPDGLQRAIAGGGGQAFSLKTAQTAIDALRRKYDSVHGGFSDEPKFPTPVVLYLLMRYYALLHRLPKTASELDALSLNELHAELAAHQYGRRGEVCARRRGDST